MSSLRFTPLTVKVNVELSPTFLSSKSISCELAKIAGALQLASILYAVEPSPPQVMVTELR